MLAALRHWQKPWSKNVIWLFCIYFGFTFVIPERGGYDTERIISQFITFSRSDLSLAELWNSFYSEGTKYADILSPLILYLVSRFTQNPSILFAVLALIFGYFYSRNIWYVLDQTSGNFKGIELLYILTMVLLNPIWQISGFRFFIAAHVFLYGTLPYLLNKNNNRLLFSGLSILLHWSFVFPVAVLILFSILKNRLTIYFILFIFTSFIKELDLEMVRSVLSSYLPDSLPDVYDQRILAYTNITYAESLIAKKESFAWYLTFSSEGIKWVVYAFILLVYFFGKETLNSVPKLKTLFCFSLLLYGLANIFSLVPSGGRFILLANTFLFPFFILLMNSIPEIKGLLLLKTLSIPALLLYCIVVIRVGMDYYGLTTLFSNPLLAAIYTDMVPLIEGIKNLLI